MRYTVKRILLYLFDRIVIKLAIRVQNRLQQDKLYNPAFATIHKKNLFEILWKRAVNESADFVEKHINDVLVFHDRRVLWEYTARKIKEQNIDGVCLEFGVFNGASINYFANYLPELRFIGFDSFEGLAEDWKGEGAWKGTFDLGGKLPSVRCNVTLVKGWFDHTLPEYCKKHLDKKSVRFVHIDGDTYEAAVIVLKHLGKYLRPGVLILFDELIGYPNWRNGEFRAWQEVTKKHNIKFRYLGFATNQALVEIVD